LGSPAHWGTLEHAQGLSDLFGNKCFMLVGVGGGLNSTVEPAICTEAACMAEQAGPKGGELLKHQLVLEPQRPHN